MIYHGDAMKYILETPKVLREIWRNRETIFRDSIRILEENTDTIYLTGAGSSYHAAVAAVDFLRELLHREVYALLPEELESMPETLPPSSACIEISQQGTSKSVIRALDMVKQRGSRTIAMTGEYQTEITCHADAVSYIVCGIEDAGATTKGFTATALSLMVLGIRYAFVRGYLKGDSLRELDQRLRTCIDLMDTIPEQMERFYHKRRDVFKNSRDLFIISDYRSRAIMLECELKFSETCRFPARGRIAESFMHGLYNKGCQEGIPRSHRFHHMVDQGRRLYVELLAVIHDAAPGASRQGCDFRSQGVNKLQMLSRRLVVPVKGAECESLDILDNFTFLILWNRHKKRRKKSPDYMAFFVMHPNFYLLI